MTKCTWPEPNLVITPSGIRRRLLSPREAIRNGWELFEKALCIVGFNLKRDVHGTWLGRLWLLLEPALHAGSYYFLIKFVFGVKGADTSFGFFYTAITFWRSNAVLVSGAPYFFISKGSHYIQHSLGLELAYLELFLQELLLLFLRFVILAMFLVISGVTPSWSWTAVVPIVLVQFTFTMSLVVWFSMIGAVVKDFGKLVGHLVWFWWYMSPGLYSAARIPMWAKPIYDLNPFATLIPATHQALLERMFPQHSWSLVWLWLASLVLLYTGWRMLNRTSYKLYKHL